jgi:CRISPR-associated protein Csb2
VQGPVLPILAAAGVATALHRAVLGRWAELTAQGVLSPIPEEVSGHDADGVPLQRPHVAFLALPAVGSRWSDGHLLGLGLALPRALAAEVRAGLWRVLSGLQTLTLRPEPWSLESVGLGGASDLPVLLKPSSWCRPAQVWGSVTPVVLDRFPSDLFGEEAEESVRVACQRAGLPGPASVVLRPTSLVLGVPPAREFPAYPSDRPTPRVHAVLIFPERVAGPVLVGRGRYRGLGLFYPLEG